MMCNDEHCRINRHADDTTNRICGPPISSSSTAGSTAKLEESLRISGAQLDQLELENARVVNQLKEVIKMNNHWQRYDSQREEYVIKLTRSNHDLTEKVSDLQRQLDDIVGRGGSKRTEISKNNIKGPMADKHGCAHHDDTPRELSAVPPPSSSSSLESSEETIAALTAHVTDLQHHISLLEREKAATGDADDQVAMMTEQINICIEDFKQERRDRERSHTENERLKERLAQSEQVILKNEEQMYVYQEQIKQLQAPIGRPVPRPVVVYDDEPLAEGYLLEDRPYRQRARSPINPNKTFRHPINLGHDLTDFGRATDLLEDDVEIDGVPEDQADGCCNTFTPATGGSGNASPQELKGAQMEVLSGDRKKVIDEEPLECPRCLASFPIDRHVDLLDHINRCLE